jgi:hypothetical protein
MSLQPRFVLSSRTKKVMSMCRDGGNDRLEELKLDLDVWEFSWFSLAAYHISTLSRHRLLPGPERPSRSSTKEECAVRRAAMPSLPENASYQAAVNRAAEGVPMMLTTTCAHYFHVSSSLMAGQRGFDFLVSSSIALDSLLVFTCASL